MRHLRTIAAALCCTLFLTACGSNESDGPDTDVVRVDIQTEINELIGGPDMVALDDLTIGEGAVLGENQKRYDAEWTGTVVVEGALFRSADPEQIGRAWLETYTPATAAGTEIQVTGSLAYLLIDGAWKTELIRIKTADGDDLRNIGVAENAIKHDLSVLAGSPEAAAKRAELEAAAKPKPTTKEQEAQDRAARDAELKQMLEDRKKAKDQGTDGATQP